MKVMRNGNVMIQLAHVLMTGTRAMKLMAVALKTSNATRGKFKASRHVDMMLKLKLKA